MQNHFQLSEILDRIISLDQLTKVIQSGQINIHVQYLVVQAIIRIGYIARYRLAGLVMGWIPDIRILDDTPCSTVGQKIKKCPGQKKTREIK